MVKRRAIEPVIATTLLLWLASPSYGATLDEAEELFRAGNYAKCIEAAVAALEAGRANESWRLLKIRSELTVGEYPQALVTLEDALRRYRWSLRLRWIGHEVYLYNDRIDEAADLLRSIERLVKQNPWSFTDPESRITLGRLFLRRGADARQVLELVYDPLKKEHPDHPEIHVASGDLALEKHDYGLATAAFQEALKLDPDDPAVLWRLSQAQAPGDPARAAKSLQAALDRNPRHVDSLLSRVDTLIDSEQYDEAKLLTERVLQVNPHHPSAWAYRAVLAHLAADAETEKASREVALGSWSTNPEVDHLIGRKLSQKYRFAEGASYQRRALALDAEHLPARLQLAQDLLRLGEEEVGWRLATEIYEKDNYNVVAYNLTTLREHLATFRTLEDEGFIVRMDPREAGIYGGQVLDLLRRARKELCARYDVELAKPTVVEIFPEQKDFAIRTFGLPGGAGFLGVCFGDVITANSPASQGDHPSNWQAVLWHEFCHVVTLRKTRNKMPRWLSEGISVYEERRANPTWGQSMTPKYREMVLGDDLTPVSRLSAAFLSPASPLHLQFAYYESSLVVEYIVARHGLEKLKQVLDDLAAGVLINDALARSMGSLDEFDSGFAAFARSRAESLAPQADWERPELPDDIDAAGLAAWNEEHPDNFWGLQLHAARLLREEKWREAQQPLRRLIELCPECAGADSPYALLALTHRKLDQVDEGRAALEKLATLDGDAIDAYLRLMELAANAKDWPEVVRNAERFLAVNPLLQAPHRHLARAAEELGDTERAIRAYSAQVLMDVVDPAETHFRLARLLDRSGDLDAARRQILKALEEAPRYRQAHRLLLEIVRQRERERHDDSKPF